MEKPTEAGLRILSEVGRISNSTLELDAILNQTITIIKDNLQFDACALYLVDGEGETQRLKLKASSGLPQARASKVYLPWGKGITGWVAQNKIPQALSEAIQDPRFVYFPEIEEERYQSMLSVPMTYQGDCIGVINVHSIANRFFTPVEITLLKTISEQITGCIRNGMEYAKSKALLREQTLLYEISQAVAAEPHLENRLHLLLTGISLAEGHGIHRAILFLLDDQQTQFKGVMGVGPDSLQEARSIWAQWADPNEEKVSKLLLHESFKDLKNTRFHQTAQELEFPFIKKQNVLSDALVGDCPVIVENASVNARVPKELPQKLGVDEFILVPLIAHDIPFGVILIDNLYNETGIRETDLKLFVRLANQTSWVIENSRLFNKLLESNRELLTTKEQLVQSEKLAALGELSAEVAHEIKNPLVSIGGFARRLQEKMHALTLRQESKPDLTPLAHYAKIIANEVERLEVLLKNILVFPKGARPVLKLCHLPKLIGQVLDCFEMELRSASIRTRLDFEEDPSPIALDEEQIKQVLINVIFNAIESMRQGGVLEITTFTRQPEGQSSQAVIQVRDTGGGIDQEAFQNIFNPFFTTKDSGTGLGLSISRRIMENHGGEIRVHNNVNEGVTVQLVLPLQIDRVSNKT